MSLSYMNMLLFKSMHGRPLFKRGKKHVKFEKEWRKCFGIQPAYGDFFKKVIHEHEQEYWPAN